MRGNTGKNEDTGSDNCAHAEGGELYGSKDAPQPILACHFAQQQAQRLPCKQCAGH